MDMEAVNHLDPVTVRALASIHEASAVAANAHIFDAPFPRAETLERWHSYSGSVVIAWHGRTQVGFVAWQGEWLDALYVLPDVAGHGVGAHLLEQAAGVSRLWVLAANYRARRFYERRGWRSSGDTLWVSPGVLDLEYRHSVVASEK